MVRRRLTRTVAVPVAASALLAVRLNSTSQPGPCTTESLPADPKAEPRHSCSWTEPVHSSEPSTRWSPHRTSVDHMPTWEQHCAIEAISRIGSGAVDPHRTARSNSDFEWQSHSGIARNLDIAGDVLASIDGGADPLTLTDSIERAVVAGTARLLEGSELDTQRQHDHLGEACGSTVPRW